MVIAGLRDLGHYAKFRDGRKSECKLIQLAGIISGKSICIRHKRVAPTIADLDGDNKPEVCFAYTNVATFTTERGIFIFHNESFPVPTVTSISPVSAAAGNALSFNGDLMYTYNTPPTIRLSNLLLPISGTPTNALTIATPFPGTISSNMLVTNHGLTEISKYFNETFASGQIINTTSFGPSVDFTLSNNIRDGLEIADFDDDGKNDVYVVDNTSTGKVFRNTATAGATITTASLTVAPTTFAGSAKSSRLTLMVTGK